MMGSIPTPTNASSSSSMQTWSLFGAAAVAVAVAVVSVVAGLVVALLVLLVVTLLRRQPDAKTVSCTTADDDALNVANVQPVSTTACVLAAAPKTTPTGNT